MLYSPCSEESRTEKTFSIEHLVTEIFYVEVVRNQHLWQQLSFYFHCFLQSPIANMVANYICMKYGISHDRGGHFVPFSVISAQKMRFKEQKFVWEVMFSFYGYITWKC